MNFETSIMFHDHAKRVDHLPNLASDVILSGIANEKGKVVHTLPASASQGVTMTSNNQIVPYPLSAKNVKGVYIAMYAELPGLYKIGSAGNIETRMHSLRTHMPFDIVLVHVLECQSLLDARLLEKVMHRKYDAQRLRREWFQLTEQDITNIKTGLGILKSCLGDHPAQVDENSAIAVAGILEAMWNGSSLRVGQSSQNTAYLDRQQVIMQTLTDLVKGNYIQEKGIVPGKRGYSFTEYELTSEIRNLLSGDACAEERQ